MDSAMAGSGATSDPLAGLNSHQKGQLGVHYAAAAAIAAGHKVTVVYESRKQRLRINERHLVEVRTTRILTDADGWSVSDAFQPFAADTTGVILADRADHEHWRFYIADAAELVGKVAAAHRDYLQRRDGQRARNQDSQQTTIRVELLAGSCGRWDMLA